MQGNWMGAWEAPGAPFMQPGGGRGSGHPYMLKLYRMHISPPVMQVIHRKA